MRFGSVDHPLGSPIVRSGTPRIPHQHVLAMPNKVAGRGELDGLADVLTWRPYGFVIGNRATTVQAVQPIDRFRICRCSIGARGSSCDCKEPVWGEGKSRP